MKKYLLFLILILPFVVSCNNQKTEKNPVWSDEFNYTGLPDPEKWAYEEGFIRNREPQYYTKERIENTRVDGDNLIITAIKENFNGAKYTSASVITKGKYEFTYGRVEVRAKLPEGKNVWPAIWTLGANIGSAGWPLCGEIDIMEFLGTSPNSVSANVHTKDYNHTRGNGRGGKIAVEKPWEDFHIYALEWYPDRLDFFFDDKMYFTCPKKGEGIGEWPFDAPQYLLINLALTGNNEEIDDSIFPVEYRIDYVRIYNFK